ncbi:MAG: aldose 1-epimerase family protein [Clostridia bacterium]|nr:aldose 1-epimerase family protein [Clostridia bacterium]
MITIKNEKLTVLIDELGAQLRSIKSVGGTEYLWQADDPAIWADQAPNLFPYIARLTEKQYTFEGKTYHMGSHGFAKDTVFAVEQDREDHAVFRIADSEESRAQYPFAFGLGIEYTLQGSSLAIRYIVENKDSKTMYFGVGGHPGFRVPLEEGLAFEDYYLEFDDAAEVLQVGMSPDCYVTEKDVPFEMERGVILPLRHTMFDDDAIILTQMSKGVTLKSDKSGKALRVFYPEMRYLGIWHRPFTEAAYVCIEPWSSLPSRKGIIEDLSTQPSLLSLEPGKTYTNEYVIEVQE